MYSEQVFALRRFLHCSTCDIERMSIYEGAELIDNAIKDRDKSDMFLMQMNGIDPSEIEYYSRYFEEVESETSVEDGIEHAQQVLKMLKEMNQGGK